MRAIVCTAYGTPDVLTLEDRPKPVPGPQEMLVRVAATAVNSADVRIRRADPKAVRLFFGFKRPRNPVLGGVFAGTVEAVGTAVTRFKPGEEVFGTTGMTFGAYAEWVCVPADGAIARKPERLSFNEAAVIPFGGTTALDFLRKANVRSGQRVLVYGASGAVGATAVQLAKHRGARVTAVCSGSNAGWVKALGADEVLDYSAGPVFARPESYDVIFETVNKAGIDQAMARLAPGGTLVLVAALFSDMLLGSVKGLLRRRRVLSGMIQETAADMEYLAGLAEQGVLKPVIDRIYPLEAMAEAHAYVDGGHKKGNVCIEV